MRAENQLDELIAEYKQDRKKHHIKWMWVDFKSWVLTSINWVRIKLTKNKKMNFNRYLIMVGIRSLEFTYTDDELLSNVKYFERCMKRGLSPYKALLFLSDEL